MSFLYRHALFVSRKQPYIDWANSLEDGGPNLDESLSHQQRTVYLLAELDDEPGIDDLLSDCWEHVFEEELAGWHLDQQAWPSPRTRQLFDAWFDVELCSSVYDLDPDAPLTQREVDALDLSDAIGRCASCGIDIDESGGRYVGFKVADPQRVDLWRGRVLPLPIDDEQVVLVIPRPVGSEEFGTDDDLLVRVCSSGCEKAIRKVVPKALRRLFARPSSQL